MSRYIFIFLFLFANSHTSSAQTIYHLRYKSPVANDTATHDALFVKYDNGNGFVRISYPSQPANKNIWVEMNIQEHYAKKRDGSFDTSTLFYPGTKPVFKNYTSRTKFTPLNFWFKLNDDNTTEPWAVTSGTATILPATNNLLSAEFISSYQLTKEFILRFFNSNEQFYNNLFGPRSKGGMLTTEEKKSKLILLVVASTHDEEIGPACLVDARKMIQTFSDVAEFLGIRKIIDSVFGDNYNRVTIKKAIDRINPSPSDIVVFYYSGHGFTNPAIPSKKYPFLDVLDPRIKPRPNPRDSALNIEDIYETIKRKGARLNLVISDCCNDRIEQKNIVGIPPPQHRSTGLKWNWTNVKTLFMNPRKTSLLITSANKGERATSKNSFGSFYTYYFLSSLTTYVGPDKINPWWIQVLADAQRQTINKANHMYCPLPNNPKNICRQTPPPPKVN